MSDIGIFEWLLIFDKITVDDYITIRIIEFVIGLIIAVIFFILCYIWDR